MSAVEIVYLGRDNTIELELHENGVNIADYSAITRVKITTLSGDIIDSDVSPALIDWAGSKIIIDAGQSNLTVGRHTAKLETWDPDNANGIVWTERLYLQVRA